MEQRPTFSGLALAGWASGKAWWLWSIATWLVAATAGAKSAHDEAHAIALTVQVPNELAGCPDQAYLESAVRRRLGYSPFAKKAQRSVSVRIEELNQELQVTIRIADQKTTSGVRQFTTKDTNCAEAMETAGLMLSLSLADVARSQRETAAARDDHGDISDAGPAPEQPRPASSHPFASVGLGAAIQRGYSPGWSPALRLHVEFGGVQWSLQTDGSVELPETTRRPDGSGINSWLLNLSIAPCLKHRAVFGCAVITAGALRAEGTGIEEIRSGWAPTLHAGMRAGWNVPIWGPFVGRGQLDVAAGVARARISVDGSSRWTSPPVAAAASFVLVGTFQ